MDPPSRHTQFNRANERSTAELSHGGVLHYQPAGRRAIGADHVTAQPAMSADHRNEKCQVVLVDDPHWRPVRVLSTSTGVEVGEPRLLLTISAAQQLDAKVRFGTVVIIASFR